MMSSLTPLPAFQDNYIWTMTGSNGRSIIVDPGDAAPVIAACQAGLRPCAILITHHHHDHVGGVEELVRRYDLPVYAPDDPRVPMATHHVGDGDAIAIDGAGLRFSVLHVPGHTLSHLAYIGEGVAFTGDTLFSMGCGRLFEGSPDQMHHSLQRLAALPGDTLVCCAHEYTLANGAFAKAVEPDSPALDARIAEARAARAAGQPTLPVRLATEQATNPFLRCDEPAVIAAVTGQTGTTPNGPVEVFAALRQWKDGFVAP